MLYFIAFISNFLFAFAFRDAAMMREKQKKAEEKQASGASGGAKK